MLNKTDKTFIVSAIVFIASLLVPILSIITSDLIPAESYRYLYFTFVLSLILYLVFIPISYIIQIITLILKLLAKNKNKKDWIIISTNFCFILIFSFIILCLIGLAIAL